MKLNQQPRTPRISEKTITLVEQRRNHQHERNKSQYNRHRNLKNRQTKKDKEEWLGYQLNRGYTENSYNFIRKLFWKNQNKIYYYWIKGGRTLIEVEEIADKWQQYIEVLYNDSEELED